MRAESLAVESELALFGRFSRAFTHILRGDLSVITNEISYLATKLPAGELDRASNRCSQMASTISKIAGLNTELSVELIPYDDIARMFGIRELTPARAGGVYMDRVRGERLSLMMRYLLGGELTGALEISNPEALLSMHLLTLGPETERREYRSWSSFATQERGERYVIEGVVADLLLRACGWGVQIVVGDGRTSAHVSVQDNGLSRGT
jgi:hypothetical protein